MKITFIQTGGTIDKDYPRVSKGYAFEIHEPAAKSILKKLNPSFSYEIIPAIKKDSTDINEKDRKKILEICRQISSHKIIITHGTDTMIETARVLNQIRDKVIILTGAMLPEKFSDSDAAVNLGVAIGACNVIDQGIYIAMHGLVLEWNNCSRDKKTGQFKPKRS